MPEPIPCTTCGSPLQVDAKFCGTCGTPTIAAGGPAPEPPVAAPPTVSPPAEPPSDPPTTPTTAFGTGDPDAPSKPSLAGDSLPPIVPPTQVGGIGPIGATSKAAPVDQPGGFAAAGSPPPTAPTTPPGGLPPIAFPPTVANPTAAPLPPTLADQAIAASGGAGSGGAPPGGPGGPGGPPTGGERPYWMPDPSKESKSSRTGLFIVLGVAGGVLLTLVALVLWLTVGGDDGDDVSSGDTTSTTQEETTTSTTEDETTTTTEQETTTTSEPTTTTTTTTAPGGSTALADLEVGDCVTQDVGAPDLTAFDVVDCGTSHRAEMYATFTVPDGPYPESSDANQIITERCLGDAFEAYVGRDYRSSQIYVTGVFPDEGTWDAGTRTIHCFGHEQDSNQTFTGTIGNSNR